MQDASKRKRLRNWKQKITVDQVRQIREMSGKQKDIAAHFGLDPSTISKIRSHKIWKGLT